MWGSLPHLTFTIKTVLFCVFHTYNGEMFTQLQTTATGFNCVLISHLVSSAAQQWPSDLCPVPLTVTAQCYILWHRCVWPAIMYEALLSVSSVSSKHLSYLCYWWPFWTHDALSWMRLCKDVAPGHFSCCGFGSRSRCGLPNTQCYGGYRNDAGL